MVKKSLIFFLSFLLLINFASALTLTDPSTWDDVVEFHETSPNGKYGYYEIADTLLWIFNKKQIKTVELIENDYSVFTAWNIKQIEVFEPTKLFDKTEYFGADKKTDKSNHIKSEVQLYREWINSSKEKEITLSCKSSEFITNGTNTTEVCIDWNTEFITVDTSHWTDWEHYKWGSVQAGLYQTKTIVTRDNQRTGVIDWIDTSEGHQLKEWATWWNNSWNYKRQISNLDGNISALQVINFTANMKTDFSDLRFLDNATESIELNYTIEKKINSDYALIRINNLGATSVYMYYGNSLATDNSNAEDVYFNPLSGYYLDDNANDFTGSNNGTVIGATLTSGYINNSYNFNGASDRIDFPTIPFDLSSDFTINIWFNADTLPATNYLITQGLTSDPFPAITLRNSDDKIRWFVRDAGADTMDIIGTTSFSTGGWHMATATWDVSTKTGEVFLDGFSEGSNTNVAVNTQAFNTFNIGVLERSTFAGWWDGELDEFITWNRKLSDTEIVKVFTQTQPNFVVGSEEQEVGVNTELLSPTDNFLSIIETVNFSVNSSSIEFTQIDNVTLYIWNANNLSDLITNFTSLNSNTSVVTNWTNTLEEGTYIWNAETCGTGINCEFATSNRTLLVHFTAPTINITAPNETFIHQEEGSNLSLIYNISEIGENVTEHFVECWFEYNNSESISPLNRLSNPRIFPTNYVNVTSIDFELASITNIPQGCSRSGNFTLRTTGIIPNLRLECLLLNGSYEDFGSLSQSIPSSTNITAMQKRPLNCIGNNESFEYVQDNNSLCVHAIDEFGLHSENVTSWGYVFEVFNLTYDTPVYEGSLNTFSSRIRLGQSATITQAIFNFDDTNYTTNIIFSGGEYLVTSSITAPVVSTDTNFTLGFYIDIDGIFYFINSKNQTVLNLDFGACGVGDDLLLNISLVEEGTRTSIIGDIELNAQLIGKITEEVTETTNVTFENVNYGAICLTPTIAKENFFLDVEIRYESTDYAPEFYNIQMANLSLYPKNLTVFDLALNDSTEFLVTYQDDDLIKVEGAVIQLQRKYIGSDAFEVVEAPITSDGGTAILHIDLNTNVYQATVVKNGEVLDIFDNLVFNCENELSGQCTESLLGIIDPQNVVTLESLNDFTYSIS